MLGDLPCPPVPWPDEQKPVCCCGSLQVPATAPCQISFCRRGRGRACPGLSVLLTHPLIPNHCLKLFRTEFAQQNLWLIRVQILLVVCTYLKWGHSFHLFVNFSKRIYLYIIWGACLDTLMVITQCEKHTPNIYMERTFFNFLTSWSITVIIHLAGQCHLNDRASFRGINGTSNYIKAIFGSSRCAVTTWKFWLFSVIP